MLKNDNDNIEEISKAVAQLKQNNDSVLVQNEIPENIKYSKAYKLTEKGAVEI